MKQFKDLGIQKSQNGFVGDKIPIEKIFNRQIIIHDYKIRPSRFKDTGSGKCLDLQIEIDGEKRVIFTGSGVLIDLISQVNKDVLPITTTIVKENKHFEFQ